MAGYRFPGVFPTIVDNSEVVADNTIVSAAYVGESEYGPVFKPTLLSSLQDYTNKFGKLNSRYGYAGYSLAVAAETISQHYFVRVVPTGEAGEHTANDAKWGIANFAKTGATASAATPMYYEEVKAAQVARDAGDNSGLFVDDTNTAFKVVATNPNNRDFYISIENSTINENKAYPISAPTVLTINDGDDESSYDDDTTTVLVTVPCQSNPDGTYGLGGEFKDAVAGLDKIAVSKMTNTDLNGTFTIENIEIDEENQVAKISYIVDGRQTTAGDGNARIGLYPEDDQTTFSLTLSEKVGRVISVLESYEFLTLYPAQDQYGNSTFIEDVINGSSEHIQVFANTKLVEENTIIPTYVSNVQLAGGQSGTFADASAKYSKLCEAWELFRDRSQVTVSLLLNSGYVLKGNTSYKANMLEIAEARRDCFCLFDCPMTETDYEDLIDWRRNIQGFNTYRGALSAPWVKTYDSIQGRANFVMCPSAYVAKIMGAYEPWKAPAGLNRGVLSAAAVAPTGLTQYYNETQGGNLYTDNQVNCIVRNPGAGYVNWGQRTLQQKPSALDRINVARTVIYIETVLRDAARYHVFENNTASERQQITLQFNAFLDQVLSSDGIGSYRVICNETNNTAQVIANNQMKIDIYLTPVYCAEFILITTTVENGISTTTVSTGS